MKVQPSQRGHVWAECREQSVGSWVKWALGAPEAGSLSLTCIPQKYSPHLSSAGTLDLCVRPPSLSLVRRDWGKCDAIKQRRRNR